MDRRYENEPAPPQSLGLKTPALGVSIIVAYKLVKAAVWFAASAALTIALRLGETARIGLWAEGLQTHLTQAWAVRAARALAAFTAPGRVRLAIVALLLDGALTLVEGWTLHRRYWFAPWLIVVATSSLLPLELFELTRAVRLGRLIILLVNAAVVLYLARRALRERQARRSAAPR
jgi:uncharacterized membrane protein (DUF2068 family)